MQINSILLVNRLGKITSIVASLPWTNHRPVSMQRVEAVMEEVIGSGPGTINYEGVLMKLVKTSCKQLEKQLKEFGTDCFA